jgi:RNA polymerase sigma factor (sigma-70 family)
VVDASTKGVDASISELHASIIWKKIMGLLWQLLPHWHSDEVRETVAHDALQKLRRSYGKERHPARVWDCLLFRTVRTTAYDYLRKVIPEEDKLVVMTAEYQAALKDPFDAVADVDQADEIHRLRNALSSLAQAERELIVRYYWDQWTLKDLADHFGVKGPSTILNRLRCAHHKLRRCLTLTPLGE